MAFALAVLELPFIPPLTKRFVRVKLGLKVFGFFSFAYTLDLRNSNESREHRTSPSSTFPRRRLLWLLLFWRSAILWLGLGAFFNVHPSPPEHHPPPFFLMTFHVAVVGQAVGPPPLDLHFL